MRPRTGYALNGDVRIAYQVVGDGPIDLVMTPPFISHVDLWWMLPETSRFMERLASFSRLVLYDKRGTGLSDPAVGSQALEDRVEDLHAVLDAVGAAQPALMGISEGGPLSMMFAATHPDRVRALVLMGSFARLPDEGYFPELVEWLDDVRREIPTMEETWGEGRLVDIFAPDYADDPSARASFGLYERLSASPSMARAVLEAAMEIDVSHVLSSIAVPTLVVNRLAEIVPIQLARDIATRIPGARLIELPGTNHLPWLADIDAVLDPLEEFLTGAAAAHEPDRALVTTLFTDIVGSTELAAELGDTRWRALLERHDAVLAQEVNRAGGSVVKSLGDGMFARFDSPARAIRCAQRVVSEAPDELGVQIRAGVHTGECEIRGDDLGGMAVHVGARVAAKATGGEVLVSSAVRDLVLGSPIEFEERGDHELKGVPGTWRLLAITAARVTEPPPTVAPAYAIAPNAEISTASDRAVARIARMNQTNPRVGGVLTRALQRTGRLRRAPIT
jgi:class 3 adenylate cyclase